MTPYFYLPWLPCIATNPRQVKVRGHELFYLFVFGLFTNSPFGLNNDILLNYGFKIAAVATPHTF